MKDFTIDGFVAQNVETKATQSGRMVTKFSVNSPDYDRKTQERTPQYFDCEFWHDQGDPKAAMIQEGALLLVWGQLHQDKWTDRNTGQNRSKVVLRPARSRRSARRSRGGSRPPAAAGRLTRRRATRSLPRCRRPTRRPRRCRRATRSRPVPPAACGLRVRPAGAPAGRAPARTGTGPRRGDLRRGHPVLGGRPCRCWTH
ncbi:MAG: single-stranded DNA-binding protein [Collinsella intestinalis]